MYVKQLFENKTVSKVVIITLEILYVLSILTFTVSFFTPNWLLDVFRVSGNGYQSSNSSPLAFYRRCNALGLVSGDCRFPYSDNSVLKDYSTTFSVTSRDDTDMRRTFYYMLAVMCILYSNVAMAIGAIIFNLLDSRSYMSILSVSHGLLFPLGAILLLVATITLEVNNPSSFGYSVILGNVSGGLILLFYAGLLFYDHQYRKYRLKHVGGVPMDRVKAEHYN